METMTECTHEATSLDTEFVWRCNACGSMVDALDDDPEHERYVMYRGRFSIQYGPESLTGLTLPEVLAEADAMSTDARWQTDEAVSTLAKLNVGEDITLDGLSIARRA